MTMRGFGVVSSTTGIVIVRDLRTISNGLSIMGSIDDFVGDSDGLLGLTADGGGSRLAALIFDVMSAKGESCF